VEVIDGGCGGGLGDAQRGRSMGAFTSFREHEEALALALPSISKHNESDVCRGRSAKFGCALVERWCTQLTSLVLVYGVAQRLCWLLLDLSHLYHLYYAHTSDVGLKGLLPQNNRRIQVQSSSMFYPNREDIPILRKKYEGGFVGFSSSDPNLG
jgi:hypothetical protein